jgi:hypothetical protein
MAMLLTGCSLSYKDWNHSLFQFVPSDVIQTGTTSVIGVDLSPVGADGPAVRVGYVRSQRTSVPGFDAGTYVPDVSATTSVDANSGAFISETLAISSLVADQAE